MAWESVVSQEGTLAALVVPASSPRRIVTPRYSIVPAPVRVAVLVEVDFDASTSDENHVDVGIFAVLGFGVGAHLD